MTRGIDISQWQPTWPAGAPTEADWTFAFVRATHDAGGRDPLFDQHFADAATKVAHRGAYHFWAPEASSAVSQAALFAQECIQAGFLPGKDLWALDAEATALASPAGNAQWVADFMRNTSAILGGRGFLYVGWPFAEAHFPNPAAFLRAYNWWLPAYGPNDGAEHPYDAPFVPVLHQYTSHGGPGLSGLDVNAVTDAGVWQRIVGSTQPQVPLPKPSPPRQLPPRDIGDSSMQLTNITGVHLDAHGCGAVAVKGVPEADVGDVLIVGGSNPLDVKRNDKVPVARVVAKTNPAIVAIIGGEPAGTYTVRVTHV